MCDFLDQAGKPLTPGDKIEYWGVEKEWIKATVSRVESITSLKYYTDDNGNRAKRPETTTKILVSFTRGDNPTRPYHSNDVKLTKSANIRKVL